MGGELEFPVVAVRGALQKNYGHYLLFAIRTQQEEEEVSRIVLGTVETFLWSKTGKKIQPNCQKQNAKLEGDPRRGL